MSEIILKKSKYLKGEVNINGAKNAALPIIAATLLTDKSCTLLNVPQLTDINNMFEILKRIGYNYEKTKNGYIIIPGKIKSYKTLYDETNKLRASFLIAGPMLTKFGRVQISHPGGCQIGSRPVDLHLKGFEALGAKIEKKHGFIDISTDKLKGAKIYFDFPSVGATENIIMASTLADGRTIIENAAVEPEIVDLANFINSMGGNIMGAGTDTVIIEGVSKLKGCTHSIIPDRIEAGTYMVAAAITKGAIKLNNIIPEHLRPICAKLKEVGANIEEQNNSLNICCDCTLKPSDIKTLPYPGFPTDMQAQFTALNSVLKGTSMITETIFENRFQHISELKRMGANIRIDGRCAVIEGTRLSGARVHVPDLRGGAALILAGLSADGETIVDNSELILRGYSNITANLSNLGANIKTAQSN